MPETIYQYFLATANKYSDRTALMYKKNGRYQEITYEEFRNRVDALADELSRMGIKKGDTVGIYSYNRPEWAITDLAILKLGAIVVPIYHVLSPFYVKYIINDANLKLLFIENAELYKSFNTIKHQTPKLEKIALFDDAGFETETNFHRFSDMIKPKNNTLTQEPNVTSSDIATIVYTSGTTGEPKGAILTHANIISNTVTAVNIFGINYKDVIMSYLPLSHMFERTAGYYVMIFSGGAIGYAENLTTIVDDIKKIRPTVVIALPRVLEKAYETAAEKIEKSSALTKKMVYSAIKNLNEYVNLKYKKLPIPFGLKIKRLIYNQLVAKKFRKIAGGRIRILCSGGAPLNRTIGKIFYILGFKVTEGYGLTETSPVISASTIDEIRLGTVGKIFPDVQVKIGQNDEILVKGPNVMLGYYNKPEETRQAIDQDGWFHTGDQGKFDEFGNLVITGRIKELIITSYGKKIPPIPIEEKLCKCGYIDQVMLFGDNKNFIIALIVPRKNSLEFYAKSKNISYADYRQLLDHPEIKLLIKNELDIAGQDLAPYEKVKAFALLSEGFTIDNGLLTPTLKLRRGKVIEKYLNLIEETYQKAIKEKE
jgi:long-chain acyl-CoA synthetase